MGVPGGGHKCARSLGCIWNCPAKAITQQVATSTLASCWELSALSPSSQGMIRLLGTARRWGGFMCCMDGISSNRTVDSIKCLENAAPCNSGHCDPQTKVIHPVQNTAKDIRVVMRTFPILYLLSIWFYSSLVWKCWVNSLAMQGQSCTVLVRDTVVSFDGQS